MAVHVFFKNGAFNALSSSLRCSGDKSFLLLLMFRAFVALMVVASRISYPLLRCRSATWGFSACLCVLINSQFPRRRSARVSNILARRQANLRVSHLSPAAGNRQENLGRLLANAACCTSVSIRFQYPPACEASESNFLPPTRKAGNHAWEHSSTPSRSSAIRRKVCLRSSRDSVDCGLSDHHRTAYVYCSGPNHGQPFR